MVLGSQVLSLANQDGASAAHGPGVSIPRRVLRCSHTVSVMRLMRSRLCQYPKGFSSAHARAEALAARAVRCQYPVGSQVLSRSVRRAEDRAQDRVNTLLGSQVLSRVSALTDPTADLDAAIASVNTLLGSQVLSHPIVRSRARVA